MSRLPSGMYIPGNSFVYRIDSLTKFMVLIIFIVAVVCTDTLAGYGILTLEALILVAISRVPWRVAFEFVRRMYLFFVVIFIMNLCFYNATAPWLSLWFFTPSYEGLQQGINVIFRLIIILLVSNVVLTTTSPLEITNAISRIIKPLRLLGIPSDQVAMIVSISIQFIPTLLEEADTIKKAQTARGAKFDSTKLLDKAKAVIPLIVPVFVAGFKRADELSLAMEARGYRADAPRKSAKIGRFKLMDAVALVGAGILAGMQIYFL
ncbi:MAG: energy-coupling factor transporter transmembrane component T [Bacillota bacterium]|nr:energy-coupling factor transporter transmembrane component T [Bacillota bacterium]